MIPLSVHAFILMRLAKYLDKKGNIYVLDEPITGTPKEMAEHGNTITAEYLRKSLRGKLFGDKNRDLQ